jgi:hypothetical protein
MRTHLQRDMMIRFYLDAFKDARDLTTWHNFIDDFDIIENLDIIKNIDIIDDFDITDDFNIINDFDIIKNIDVIDDFDIIENIDIINDFDITSFVFKRKRSDLHDEKNCDCRDFDVAWKTDLKRHDIDIQSQKEVLLLFSSMMYVN